MVNLQESLRVLIVEDEELAQTQLRSAIGTTGISLAVDWVLDYESAISSIFSTFYDIVILDLQLHENAYRSESEDSWEGLWILQDLAEAGLQKRLPVIISSGRTRERPGVVGTAFRDFKVLDVWFKNELDAYPSYFSEIVDREKYFGLTCKVTFESSLSWPILVKTLGDKLKRVSSAINADDADTELKHILRRLFRDYAAIHVAPLAEGFSGAAVQLVTPYLEDHSECAKVVVKYGAAEQILAEERNYNQVRPFMQGTRLTQIQGTSAGLHLAAIAYSFVGSSDGSLKSFAQFYAGASVEEVKDSLTDVFAQTCKLWYVPANRSELKEPTLQQSYESYLGFNAKSIESAFGFKYRERPLNQPISIPPISTIFDHPIQHFVSGKFSFPIRSFSCRTHGDLHTSNIFVDQKTKVGWLIDFGRTGLGHWARDFVCLEASMVLQLTPLHPLPRVYEFFDAWLRLPDLVTPIRFADSAYPEMVKVGDCVSHLRGLAHNAVSDSHMSSVQLSLEYACALYFQILNYTRLHKLIRETNRKNYVLLSLCLLSERISTLRAQAGVSERPTERPS